MPSTILVVDDEPLNLAVMSRLLNPHYRVLGARSGASALALLAGGEALPDLILLDVMMPEMDGHAVLARLRADARTQAIPVIFVTALSDEVNEEQGFALGAVDYIGKPIKPAVVLARVRTHLALKQAQDRLGEQNHWLEGELARRVRESLLAQDLTLCAMAELAETRDNDTGNHILRTQSYIRALGRRLQALGLHRDELDDEQLERIVKAAPMHDIGKIGIPDRILLKPARLDADEFEVMKTHALIGGQAIDQAVRKAVAMHVAAGAAAGAPGAAAPGGQVTPAAVRFLEMARTIAIHHHERWDGLGYPDGLAGEAIPLPARLMALADVFDALTTRRVYKAPWTLDDALGYIAAQSGRQFDPVLVEALLAIRGEFAAIMSQLADA
ncbi:HD-GYP domain-containing protein [Aquabacterium sp. OR-4]|uniref:HD-GYP domain-containing protein n=1 Tax=Aquabacterium sp. OR-4 TaxID=2978127 RepID=UPI0028C9E088|nr:HD domain-containing phosphohydrolase [Aquabacterium sp. OR-4]MDT7833964.1 response regulator [Aquabacterium sp. OR-4]